MSLLNEYKKLKKSIVYTLYERLSILDQSPQWSQYDKRMGCFVVMTEEKEQQNREV